MYKVAKKNDKDSLDDLALRINEYGFSVGKELVICDEPYAPASPAYPYEEGGYYPPVNAEETSIFAQVRVRFELH